MSKAVFKGTDSVMISNMQHLINNKEFSDVHFLIGPERKEFYAHRAILSARSEVFAAVFKEIDWPSESSGSNLAKSQLRSNPRASANVRKLNEIDLLPTKKFDPKTPLIFQDISCKTFSLLLEFIYTNSVNFEDVSLDTALDLLSFTESYGLFDLKKLIQEYFLSILTTNNVINILDTAMQYCNDSFQQKLFRFFISNFKTIVCDDELLNHISDNIMHILVQREDIPVEEIQFVNIVMRWCNLYFEQKRQNNSSKSLSKPQKQPDKKSNGNIEPTSFHKITEHLRLGLLTTDELSELEQRNQDFPIFSLHSFTAGWKTQALKNSNSTQNIEIQQKRTGIKSKK